MFGPCSVFEGLQQQSRVDFPLDWRYDDKAYNYQDQATGRNYGKIRWSAPFSIKEENKDELLTNFNIYNYEY